MFDLRRSITGEESRELALAYVAITATGFLCLIGLALPPLLLVSVPLLFLSIRHRFRLVREFKYRHGLLGDR